jgi:hypothetical protein
MRNERLTPGEKGKPHIAARFKANMIKAAIQLLQNSDAELVLLV